MSEFLPEEPKSFTYTSFNDPQKYIYTSDTSSMINIPKPRMVVYLVFQDNIEYFDLKGVFTTRKNAEEFVIKSGHYGCSICETLVDPEDYPEHMHDPGTSYYDGKYVR